MLRQIAKFRRSHRYAPTVRELSRLMGYATPSAPHYHLRKLREEGLVTWTDGVSRSLQLTEAGRKMISPA